LEEENKNNKGNDDDMATKNKDIEEQRAIFEQKFKERLIHVKEHMKELECCDDLNMR